MSETSNSGYNIQFRDADGRPLYPIVRASGVIMPDNNFLGQKGYALKSELLTDVALVRDELPAASDADRRRIYCIPAQLGTGYTKFIVIATTTLEGGTTFEWEAISGASSSPGEPGETPEGFDEFKALVEAALAKKASSENVYTKEETRAVVAEATSLDVSYESLGEEVYLPVDSLPPSFTPPSTENPTE